MTSFQESSAEIGEFFLATIAAAHADKRMNLAHGERWATYLDQLSHQIQNPVQRDRSELTSFLESITDGDLSAQMKTAMDKPDGLLSATRKRYLSVGNIPEAPYYVRVLKAVNPAGRIGRVFPEESAAWRKIAQLDAHLGESAAWTQLGGDVPVIYIPWDMARDFIRITHGEDRLLGRETLIVAHEWMHTQLDTIVGFGQQLVLGSDFGEAHADLFSGDYGYSDVADFHEAIKLITGVDIRIALATVREQKHVIPFYEIVAEAMSPTQLLLLADMSPASYAKALSPEQRQSAPAWPFNGSKREAFLRQLLIGEYAKHGIGDVRDHIQGVIDGWPDGYFRRYDSLKDVYGLRLPGDIEMQYANTARHRKASMPEPTTVERLQDKAANALRSKDFGVDIGLVD